MSVPKLNTVKDAADYILITATVLLAILAGFQLFLLKRSIDAAKESAWTLPWRARRSLMRRLLQANRPKLVVRDLNSALRKRNAQLWRQWSFLDFEYRRHQGLAREQLLLKS